MKYFTHYQIFEEMNDAIKSFITKYQPGFYAKDVRIAEKLVSTLEEFKWIIKRIDENA